MPSRRIIPQTTKCLSAISILHSGSAMALLLNDNLLEYQSLLTIIFIFIFWQLKKEMVGLTVTMTKV